MSNKTLVILAILAVILVGWVVLQQRIENKQPTYQFAKAPLIQGLEIESIDKIEIISQKGQNKVILQRKEGRFVLADKCDYPAAISKINSLLNNCLDIRPTELITDSAANHEDLQVTEQTAQYAIYFYNSEGNKLTGLLISERKSNPDGAFARLVNEDRVYFIQSPPWFSTSAMDYLDRQLFQLERDKIQSVEVSYPDGHYVLKAAADGGDAVNIEPPIPDGKQFKGSIYRNVFTALTYMQMDDVFSPDKAPEGLDFNRKYICRLKDTTIYDIELAKKDDKTYAKISADFGDKTPVEKERRVESEEELKAKEAKLKAIEAVNTFNKRHQGWIYEIPSYKAGDLTKTVEELLEDKPAPQPTENKSEPTSSEQQNSADKSSSETVSKES